MEHVALGPGYGDDEIEEALKGYSFAWEKTDLKTAAETAAQALAEERIVGLFTGRLEFGPRALGRRTILVNPAKKEINDIVNQRLKRSEFMPFAPVVLAECYHDIFRGEKLDGALEAGRFMTITLDVKPEWAERIQGVVHVDDTARPQVISSEDDPLYYAIVRGFYEKTGIGCVVNTSFNLHEEPIVNTPAEALKSFADGAVDLLIMENYIVRRP
jgi:carbamoyltransferase